MRLLIATRSRHKLAEIREILDRLGEIEVVGPEDAGIPYSPEEDALEPFLTFEENAFSKAAYFSRLSDLPTVADDSGIEVDALGGAPGVHSKRFAPQGTGDRDQANNRYLLEKLADIPDRERTARYRCVAALVDRRGGRHAFSGTVEGRILRGPRGVGGFGYDPLFFVPELGRSFAEAAVAEKHAMSHRGRAFRLLAEHLRSTRFGDTPMAR